MSAPAIVALESDSIADVARLMSDACCSSIPLVDSREVLSGLVTLQDICRASGDPHRHRSLSEIPVADIATRPAPVVGPGSHVHDAMALMRRNRWRRLVVANQRGSVLGVLSLSDLIRAACPTVDAHRSVNDTGVHQDDVLLLFAETLVGSS